MIAKLLIDRPMSMMVMGEGSWIMLRKLLNLLIRLDEFTRQTRRPRRDSILFDKRIDYSKARKNELSNGFPMAP